ncbi:hypothetical protein SNEBB_009493 [Seison nebaliae]|nr:hypothetical protein SNEBB_009493 [Seison nebaliae]
MLRKDNQFTLHPLHRSGLADYDETGIPLIEWFDDNMAKAKVNIPSFKGSYPKFRIAESRSQNGKSGCLNCLKKGKKKRRKNTNHVGSVKNEESVTGRNSIVHFPNEVNILRTNEISQNSISKVNEITNESTFGENENKNENHHRNSSNNHSPSSSLSSSSSSSSSSSDIDTFNQNEQKGDLTEKNFHFNPGIINRSFRHSNEDITNEQIITTIIPITVMAKNQGKSPELINEERRKYKKINELKKKNHEKIVEQNLNINSLKYTNENYSNFYYFGNDNNLTKESEEKVRYKWTPPKHPEMTPDQNYEIKSSSMKRQPRIKESHITTNGIILQPVQLFTTNIETKNLPLQQKLDGRPEKEISTLSRTRYTFNPENNENEHHF